MELEEGGEWATVVWPGNQDAKFGNFSKPLKLQGSGKQVLWEQVFLHLEQSQHSDLFPECCRAPGASFFLLILVGRRGGCARGRVWRQPRCLPGGTEEVSQLGTEPSTGIGVVLGILLMAQALTQKWAHPREQERPGGSFPCRTAPCLALPGFLRLPAMGRGFLSFPQACWDQRGDDSAVHVDTE